MDQEPTAPERANGKKASRLGLRVLETRTYWVSHLTNEGRGARQISRGIRETLRTLAECKVWETPSFYVFDSYATIDHIAALLRLRRRVKDVFLIGSFTHAECRVVGPCEDPSLFDLVPFARQAGQAKRAPAKSALFKSLLAGRRQAMQLAKARLAEPAEEVTSA